MVKNIGFIGLGQMGKWMALNLLKSNFNLMVSDIDPAVVADFEAELFLRILPLIALLPRDYAIRFTLVRGYVSFRM